jgi:hypothetical protein
MCGGGVQDALRGETTPGPFPQLPQSDRWLALTANCQNGPGVAVCTFNGPCVAAPATVPLEKCGFGPGLDSGWLKPLTLSPTRPPSVGTRVYLKSVASRRRRSMCVALNLNGPSACTRLLNLKSEVPVPTGRLLRHSVFKFDSESSESTSDDHPPTAQHMLGIHHDAAHDVLLLTSCPTPTPPQNKHHRVFLLGIGAPHRGLSNKLAAVTQDCRCWVRYHLATPGRTCVQFEGDGMKIVLVAVDGGLVTKKKMRSGEPEGGGWQGNTTGMSSREFRGDVFTK